MTRTSLSTLLLAALAASAGPTIAAGVEQRSQDQSGALAQPLNPGSGDATTGDAPARASESTPSRTTARKATRPAQPTARKTILAQQSTSAPAGRAGAEKVAQARASGPVPLPVPEDVDVPPPPRFDIERYDVQGNTLLEERDVQQALAAYTGKSKDFADVQRALDALQGRYQAKGYGAVQVLLPEQELERGVIVFRVVEPKLGRVTVEGNKFFDEGNIRRSLPALKEGETPNSAEIGREARLANENPSKRTTVLLRAGANETDVDATVRIQDEKLWRGSVVLDNTGSSSTGMYRLGVGYQHSNMFNLDHTLTLQYMLDPQPISDFDQLKVFGVGYRIPLYGQGASLDLLGGYSDIGATSNQVIQGQNFSVAGSGTFVGARYNYTLPRLIGVEDFEHKLSFGLDYKAFSNQVAIVNAGAAGQNLTPEITVYPASITYTATKRLENAEFSLFGSAAHNVYPHGPDAYREKFNAPITAPEPGVRPSVGRPTYTVFRYGLNYVRAFANDVQMHANFNGQWSRDALVPGEQFGLGGWDSVRGMHERETQNDRGYRGSLEVYSPDWGPRLLTASMFEGAKLRLLAFVDTGRVRQNFTPTPDQCVQTVCGLGATSFGFGARMSLRQGFSLRADYGRMQDGGALGEGGDDRWHVGVGMTF
jgi:hemolysin activation/secretion protein